MYIETTAELGRRFFRAWQDRGARSAARATLSYVRGRLRLLAGPPARRTLSGKDSLDGDEPPTVSILMATWNRASLLPRAIDSVLAQIFQDWELVIVDDGSTDDTAAILAGYVGDPRIRVFHRTHVGVGAARNFAFAQSNGDIIAYLDSDNEWCGDYLQTVVEMVRGDASIQSTYCGIRRIAGNGASSVHFPPFDAERLERQNFIDLNIFCHRRVLWEKHGGFDADVHRLNDWDLIRRYARHSPPHAIAVVGAQYHEGDWPRITNTASAAYANHLILSKDEVPLGPGLKVLYLLWHYPQLSESYVETEIARMRRWGVEVEVWSETRPVSPYPVAIPVHSGSLREAIATAKPDILHIHWLNYFQRYRSVLRNSGLPITLRAHGFEFTDGLAAELNADPLVRAIFVFPQHKTAPPALDKLRVIRSAFNSQLYRPATESKDRRLVLRVSAGLPTKDLPLLFRLAKQLPEFRFVLAVVTCNLKEAYIDELTHLNEQLGRPVDLRLDMSHPAVAALMQNAGIYLNAFDPAGPPYGMPIFIAEAMASGAYVIARRVPPATDYVGNAGRLYDTEAEAAALLRETLGWSDAEWRAAGLRSVEHAFSRHVDSLALRPILDCWLGLAPNAAAADPGKTINRHRGKTGITRQVSDSPGKAAVTAVHN